MSIYDADLLNFLEKNFGLKKNSKIEGKDNIIEIRRNNLSKEIKNNNNLLKERINITPLKSEKIEESKNSKKFFL